jgi:hypothetical protein
MMAEAQADEIFVYTGGDQVVPQNVSRVRIDKSITIIPERAFYGRRRLIYVEFHDGVERIEKRAFNDCYSLIGPIKLLGARLIEYGAFCNCRGLTEVEFGSQLETIGRRAFDYCTSLRNVTMPSARIIEGWAFANCQQLTDLELPEGLDAMGEYAFNCCYRVRRIAMPLECMIGDDTFNCPDLTTVDLVGGVHRTVASLHLESWRNEMKGEMNRINQALPNTFGREKTANIQQWTRAVISRLDHYKDKHRSLLKEATTLLELALWKAKIEEKEEGSLGDVMAKRAKIDVQSKRSERRITSGANIVIKNVLPFLELN